MKGGLRQVVVPWITLLRSPTFITAANIKQWSDAQINKTAIGDQSATKKQTQKLED
jgi:hypothetical protein